jgi:hypothetical protein
MEGHELPIERGAEAARVVKALGSHRYVLGRAHDVHVLAVEAARESLGEHAELVAWADSTIATPGIDLLSRDERLVRRVSDAELCAVLSAFWSEGESAERARARLEERLSALDEPLAPPFSEEDEDGMFPVLVDAGWELLPLALLDEERHRGAIEAFGDRIAFEGERFNEENAMPPRTYLVELPAIGEAELVHLVDEDGLLIEPLVVWTEGPEPYVEYLLRGVLKVATKT